ncbi:AAA domain (dynein-related subfamily) [Prevotella sp. khp7]|uniref:AAA family ATPase n=1 Tax=Prevotella sp. khp7 TaxID=1761885 RepID=UPI0008B6EC7C|nr:AAA family ATPase [Prevotella sp. khp7]SEV82901.1 AAA domain (dynein-related subfamily) [Prevotella sp. khp7]
MADAICRWRNGTPQTVVELANSLPHIKMPIDRFRSYMAKKWGGDFFRTPYQLACQLGLYCESEDGLYYPRFDHDINEREAEEYLFFWLPRYYIPNPYTRKDGFKDLNCPTYFLKELYEYTLKNPACTYKDAYEYCFHESAKNNDDIIRNYINNYSRVLSFAKDGTLNVTNVNPNIVFKNMDRSDRKAFFDNFNNEKLPIQGIQKPLQQIFYGAPGTGKSFEINRLTKNKEVIRTTFHPDSDYSTFVGAYKPTSVEVPVRDVTGKVIIENGKQVTENRIVYEFVEQAFLQAYIKAWKAYAAAESGEPTEQFLVIEEINRGNCAQIFGDLFQLLDRNRFGFSDYPITADKDMKKQLAKAFNGIIVSDAESINGIYDRDVVNGVISGDILLLPNNLYIWATMNTSDQSLFPIDSAFKRRWDWKYVPICEGVNENGEKLGYKLKVVGKEYDWWTFLEKINHEIDEQTKSEDKKLGYFFCKAHDGVIDAETFVSKVVFYLWNDVFKDQDVASVFSDGDEELTFSKFYDTDALGKAVIKEDKVEVFLKNLGVPPLAIDSTFEGVEDEAEGDGNNYDRYSFNGSDPKGKSELGLTIVSKYLKEHQNFTFQEIKNTFPDSMLGNIGSRGLIVEADKALDSYERYYTPDLYTSSDGVSFRIYKQWTVINIGNIINFAKTQGWTVEKFDVWDRKS